MSLSYIRSCVCTRSTCVPPCDSYIALAKRSCTRRCPRALRFVDSHWMALVTVCHDCPENNRLNCLFFGCSLFYAYVGIILIVVMLCKWTCACFSFVLWCFTNTCCVWNIPYTLWNEFTCIFVQTKKKKNTHTHTHCQILSGIGINLYFPRSWAWIVEGLEQKLPPNPPRFC